jgi:hypothetical protein
MEHVSEVFGEEAREIEHLGIAKQLRGWSNKGSTRSLPLGNLTYIFQK